MDMMFNLYGLVFEHRKLKKEKCTKTVNNNNHIKIRSFMSHVGFESLPWNSTFFFVIPCSAMIFLALMKNAVKKMTMKNNI